MTLKVLPNDLQHYLEDWWLGYKLGDKFDSDSDTLLDDIVGSRAKRIEPRFNRVGWYFDGKVCWYEWKLPSGRMVATQESDAGMFKYTMNLKIAAEKRPTQAEIEAVKLLIRNSRMKAPDWYKYGLDVLHHRQMDIENHRWLKDFRKRTKDAKPD